MGPWDPWNPKVPGFSIYHAERNFIVACCVFQMLLVLSAIFGVVLYRIIMVAVFYSIQPQETIASIATSLTASVINLVAILILSLVRAQQLILDTRFPNSSFFH